MSGKTEGQSLASRVADRTNVDIDVVEELMARHGVAAATTPARTRFLRVARLRISGNKVGVPGAGRFDATFEFPGAVLMAVAPNLRGKSSLLEIITLCLRGSRRDLQADVAKWLESVECDVQINDGALGFRLRMEEGSIAQGLVFQAPSVDALTAATSGKPILEAHSDDEYADKIEALMLRRFELEPLHARDKQSGLQVHGWPSYFGAIYPPSGGDKVLIGETPMAGLAGRLLTVFLDLPRAAVLTRVKTALKSVASSRTQDVFLPSHSTELLAQQEDRLEAARDSLAKLPSAAGPSASDIANRVRRVSTDLAEAESTVRESQRACQEAEAVRQEDERALNGAREDAVAARLFHGLDPTSCPRCESTAILARKPLEASEHVCSVCTAPLSGDEDEELAQEVIQEREQVLAASREAEQQACAGVAEAKEAAKRLAAELRQAERDLTAARTAASVHERVRLEAEIARAEGAIAALDEAAQPMAAPDAGPEELVLQALEVELDREMKADAQSLVDELSDEITDLARTFGMDAISKATINLAGQLRIEKGGTKAGSFSSQSPGERLRLRIATVIALLRVGERRGVATHPGLLMLDSLRAEEVQETDAHAVLDALIAAAADTPTLQIVTTTQDEGLPAGRLADDHVLRVDESGLLW